MQITDYEQLFPHVKAHNLVWYTPNSHCAWRVESLLTKEPDTVEWIGSMLPGDVLYDVGANMGQYSMLAAKRGVRVHAFEPESQNFALMCRNIAINQLSESITPWCLALADFEHFADFHVTQLIAGGSCNSFGAPVNYHLEEKKFPFKQGAFGTRLDYFAQSVQSYPTHIKIDVDGFEHLVLEGAKNTLQSVRSVLVETNTHLPEHQVIENLMRQYNLLPDHETAEKARRKEGAFEGIGNVIYYRGGKKK